MANTYPTTGLPLGTSDPRALYNNSSNGDEAWNSESKTWVDRFSRNRKSWAGFEGDFADFLAASYFEPIHLAYIAGNSLSVARPTQLIDYNGSVWRVKMPTSFPVVLTGVWANDLAKLVDVGDMALRQSLAATSGGSLLGFKRPETGAVATSFYTMALEKYSARAHFGAKGDNVTIDTATLQAALNAISAKQGFQTTLPSAVTGAYVSNVAALDLGNGVYVIDDALTIPAYVRLVGQGAVIRQTNPSKDIISNLSNAFQVECQGIHFSGGRYQLNLQNDNLDTARFRFRDCTFSLSSGFSAKFAPVKGAGSHLSTLAVFENCGFFKPRQVAQSFCDSLTFRDCWVYLSKDNFDASRCAFELGSSSTDGYPNLYFDGMFGVPDLGTQGTDRLANVRWVDQWKGGFFANNSRFGGEGSGMPTVYYLGKLSTTYPFRGDCIVINQSEVFAGPAAANDSGVVILQGQIPQRISITNCAGPLNVPYIVNPGIASIPAYMASFEAASGQKAYSYFKFLIENNDSVAPDGTIYLARVPVELRKYINNFRATKLRRSAAQALSVSPANNYVSFDSLAYDTQGGWASGTPTRMVIPAAATSMRITVNLKVTGSSSNAGLWNVRIEDSSGATVAAQDAVLSANTDGHAFSLSYIADGNPTSWFQLNVVTTASTPGNITTCTVVTEALDYIN